MQQTLEAATQDFLEVIKKTEMYKHFKTLETQLKAKPDLMQAVGAYRKATFEIQISHRYGHYNSFEEIIGLKQSYMEVLSEPMVKEFLDAEVQLTKMVAKLYEDLSNGLDFYVDFLE